MKRNSFQWHAAIFMLVGVTICSSTTYAQNPVRSKGLHGELMLKPLSDGLNMKVVKKFSYVDSEGLEWEVPAGTVTNGASIPQALWSIVGSPFTGKYVYAAVVHDKFCETRYRSWTKTHNVFYEAMLESGVGRKQALIMWAAVYRFGPRWARAESRCWESCFDGETHHVDLKIEPVALPDRMKEIVRHVESNPDQAREELKEYIDTEIGEELGQARITGYAVVPGEDKLQFISSNSPHNWGDFGTGEAMYAIKVVNVKRGEKLRVRAEPRSGSKIVGHLLPNAQGIKIDYCRSGWCKITSSDLSGWAASTYLGAVFSKAEN